MSAPATSSPLVVWFVTTGLSSGGAERALATLVPRLPKYGVRPRVYSLRGTAPFGPILERGGVAVEDLGVRGAWSAARAAITLASRARRDAPGLLQGWMYHGNLVATAASALSAVPCTWAVRQSLADYATAPVVTRLTIRAGALASRFPRAVLYNARVALEQHRAFGYRARSEAVLPNGFDLERFSPRPEGRAAWRARVGIAETVPILGCLARLHPVKGTGVLLDAFTHLVGRPDAPHLVIAGAGATAEDRSLAEAIRTRGLDGRVHLVGEIDDVPGLLAACDVAVQASLGEGFPNAVGEAMACGVPVVATRAGDTEVLVGDAGTLVAPGDAAALAASIAAVLDLPPEQRHERGAAGRSRVAAQFSADLIAGRLATFLLDNARERGGAR